MIGRTLQHYQILEKLGEGGMGVVYKARDLRLSRFVVLKVLRPEIAGDQDSHRRFFQEAQAASALNHPNIITIHDMAAESGVAFIVMEYVEGRPLDALITGSALSVEEALRYAIQIVDALAAAHHAGVIHRDLKPANVMVTATRRVKLLDFGLAKLTARWSGGSDAATPATVQGSIIGTVSYMSPEQAMGKALDARADLFSFGTVLYEMLTGRRVFGSASPLVSLTAVLRDQPARPASINSAIPAALDALVMRCLDKNPDQRIASAEEVKRELMRIEREIQPPLVLPSSSLSEQGREALGEWTNTSLSRAKECFERAIQTERDHCPVYACMSEYYATSSLLGWREPADGMPKAEWAARKALEMDAGCEQAEVTLGLVRACFQFEWQQARRHFENLRTPDSRLRYALWYLRPLGLYNEAERLLEGNPLALAWVTLERGDFNQAAAHASSVRNPHWLAAWVFTWALLERGQVREAAEMAQRGLELEPGQPFLESALATALARDGQHAAVAEILAGERSLPAWFSIPVHSALGNPDAAFAAAQECVRRRDVGVISALRLPGTSVVRFGARFAELIRAFKLDRVDTAGAAG